MKPLKYACALIAFGFAAQASAETNYGYCEVRAWPIPSQQRGFRYHSGVVEVSAGTEWDEFSKSAFANGFASYVRSIYPGDRMLDPSCRVYGTLLEARQAESMESSSELWVHTDWLGGKAAAVDRGPKVTPKREEVELASPGKAAPGETDNPPAQRKKTNAEADAEYAAKLEQYNREMDAWRDKVAERDRLEAERKRQLADAAEQARKAKAEWEARVAACKAGDWSQCNQVTPQ